MTNFSSPLIYVFFVRTKDHVHTVLPVTDFVSVGSESSTHSYLPHYGVRQGSDVILPCIYYTLFFRVMSSKVMICRIIFTPMTARYTCPFTVTGEPEYSKSKRVSLTPVVGREPIGFFVRTKDHVHTVLPVTDFVSVGSESSTHSYLPHYGVRQGSDVILPCIYYTLFFRVMSSKVMICRIIFTPMTARYTCPFTVTGEPEYSKSKRVSLTPVVGREPIGSNSITKKTQVVSFWPFERLSLPLSAAKLRLRNQ